MPKPAPVLVEHVFGPADYIAGHLALDFANTVTARDSEPLDRLRDAAAWLDWARRGGHFPPRELKSLPDPQTPSAARALRSAKRLRESICDLGTALTRGERLPGGALLQLGAAWQRAAAAASLVPQAGRILPAWSAETAGYDFLTHRLAWAALELLGSEHRGRLRLCPGQHCGWLFLDTSKSGRRRWCDMATCGNLAKARRHYAKARQADDGG